ncbi:MAG: TetR/AcrR family transcriptional regulator [Chloroflexota bacterium]
MTKNTDRRYLRTEKRLVTAMLTLIEHKPFHEITIEDIVTQADIARKTFYAHYENKQDLLLHSLITHFQLLEEQSNELNADTLLMDNKPLSYPVFKHVASYQVFYRHMLTDENNTDFVYQFWDYIAQQSYQKHQSLRDVAPFITVRPELIAQMLSGALLGALRWWLRTDMSISPEQMAYQFSQIMAPGVLQSMGLDSLD